MSSKGILPVCPDGVKNSCELCSVACASPQELRKHESALLHHVKLEQKHRKCKHECKLCGSTHDSLVAYSRHVKEPAHKARNCSTEQPLSSHARVKCHANDSSLRPKKSHARGSRGSGSSRRNVDLQSFSCHHNRKALPFRDGAARHNAHSKSPRLLGQADSGAKTRAPLRPSLLGPYPTRLGSHLDGSSADDSWKFKQQSLVKQKFGHWQESAPQSQHEQSGLWRQPTNWTSPPRPVYVSSLLDEPIAPTSLFSSCSDTQNRAQGSSAIDSNLRGQYDREQNCILPSREWSQMPSRMHRRPEQERCNVPDFTRPPPPHSFREKQGRPFSSPYDDSISFGRHDRSDKLYDAAGQKDIFSKCTVSVNKHNDFASNSNAGGRVNNIVHDGQSVRTHLFNEHSAQDDSKKKSLSCSQKRVFWYRNKNSRKAGARQGRNADMDGCLDKHTGSWSHARQARQFSRTLGKPLCTDPYQGNAKDGSTRDDGHGGRVTTATSSTFLTTVASRLPSVHVLQQSTLASKGRKGLVARQSVDISQTSNTRDLCSLAASSVIPGCSDVSQVSLTKSERQLKKRVKLARHAPDSQVKDARPLDCGKDNLRASQCTPNSSGASDGKDSAMLLNLVSSALSTKNQMRLMHVLKKRRCVTVDATQSQPRTFHLDRESAPKCDLGALGLVVSLPDSVACEVAALFDGSEESGSASKRQKMAVQQPGSSKHSSVALDERALPAASVKIEPCDYSSSIKIEPSDYNSYGSAVAPDTSGIAGMASVSRSSVEYPAVLPSGFLTSVPTFWPGNSGTLDSTVTYEVVKQKPSGSTNDFRAEKIRCSSDYALLQKADDSKQASSNYGAYALPASLVTEQKTATCEPSIASAVHCKDSAASASSSWVMTSSLGTTPSISEQRLVSQPMTGWRLAALHTSTKVRRLQRRRNVSEPAKRAGRINVGQDLKAGWLSTSQRNRREQYIMESLHGGAVSVASSPGKSCREESITRKASKTLRSLRGKQTDGRQSIASPWLPSALSHSLPRTLLPRSNTPPSRVQSSSLPCAVSVPFTSAPPSPAIKAASVLRLLAAESPASVSSSLSSSLFSVMPQHSFATQLATSSSSALHSSCDIKAIEPSVLSLSLAIKASSSSPQVPSSGLCPELPSYFPSSSVAIASTSSATTQLPLFSLLTSSDLQPTSPNLQPANVEAMATTSAPASAASALPSNVAHLVMVILREERVRGALLHVEEDVKQMQAKIDGLQRALQELLLAKLQLQHEEAALRHTRQAAIKDVVNTNIVAEILPWLPENIDLASVASITASGDTQQELVACKTLMQKCKKSQNAAVRRTNGRRVPTEAPLTETHLSGTTAAASGEMHDQRAETSVTRARNSGNTLPRTSTAGASESNDQLTRTFVGDIIASRAAAEATCQTTAVGVSKSQLPADSITTSSTPVIVKREPQSPTSDQCYLQDKLLLDDCVSSFSVVSAADDCISQLDTRKQMPTPGLGDGSLEGLASHDLQKEKVNCPSSRQSSSCRARMTCLNASQVSQSSTNDLLKAAAADAVATTLSLLPSLSVQPLSGDESKSCSEGTPGLVARYLGSIVQEKDCRDVYPTAGKQPYMVMTESEFFSGTSADEADIGHGSHRISINEKPSSATSVMQTCSAKLVSVRSKQKPSGEMSRPDKRKKRSAASSSSSTVAGEVGAAALQDCWKDVKCHSVHDEMSALGGFCPVAEPLAPKQLQQKHASCPTIPYSGHTGAVLDMAVRGGCLYSASMDKTVRKYDLKTGTCLAVFHGHSAAVKTLRVIGSPQQGYQLYSGSVNGWLVISDTLTGETLESHDLKCGITCMSDAWSTLYVGLSSGKVVCFNIKMSSVTDTLSCSTQPVACLTTATEGGRRLLCVGSHDGSVTLRDARTGLLLRAFDMPAAATPTVLMVSEEEPLIYVAAQRSSLLAFNLYSGQQAFAIQHDCRGGRIKSAALLPGRRLLTASTDGIVRLLDLQRKALLNVYCGTRNSIMLAMCSHMNTFYTGDNCGGVSGYLLSTAAWPCQHVSCSLAFGWHEHLLHHLATDHSPCVKDVIVSQQIEVNLKEEAVLPSSTGCHGLHVGDNGHDILCEKEAHASSCASATVSSTTVDGEGCHK